MHTRFGIIIITLLLLAAAGCSSKRAGAPTPPKAAEKTSRAVTSPQPAPELDLSKVKPNELSKVMILEYHEIGDTEARWTRRYDNFRKDLQRVYDLGYRPVSLRDYVNNNISLEPGKSPVVITFDDGTKGQLNYIYANGKVKVDPNCAVAIMEEFSRTHPDWPLEATFYVYYPIPFRQKDAVREKLRHIVRLGMDIGNHTYTHTRLDLESDTGAAREMALSVRSAREHVPEATVDTIALPYGKAPKNARLLQEGEFDGVKYRNIAALLVGAEPAPSPISADFDPYKLPRIQAIQSELDMWIGYFKNNPEKRYISDGDPDTITVPKHLAADVDKAKLKGKTLRVY